MWFNEFIQWHILSWGGSGIRIALLYTRENSERLKKMTSVGSSFKLGSGTYRLELNLFPPEPENRKKYF